jgi:serine/threonine protein kinase
VEAAHENGVVHRDLKPGNVMLTPAGAVKVLDFGLAKLVADERDDTGETVTTAGSAGGLTGPGAITGTAGYMSPEQATAGKADARSDIFSFGAVLYEMVTGRTAFKGDSAAATLAAVLEHEPPPPRELVPGLPLELEKLVQRCLRKDPAKRFQSMGDVALDLDEIAASLDSWRPPPAGTKVRRRVAGLKPQRHGILPQDVRQ